MKEGDAAQHGFEICTSWYVLQVRKLQVVKLTTTSERLVPNLILDVNLYLPAQISSMKYVPIFLRISKQPAVASQIRGGAAWEGS